MSRYFPRFSLFKFHNSFRLRAKSLTPPPSLFFYGRNEYLLNLVQLIKVANDRAAASRIIINGPGGIGKTSLATALLHHPDVNVLFSEQQYFVSCETAITEALLLEAIASSLGIQAGSNDLLGVVVGFFKKVSSPLLLVLDNFETCWFSEQRREIHQVLKQLVNLGHLTLLLTMRGNHEPPEIRWERLPELPVLSLPDARKLLADIAEKDFPFDTRVDELLQALDCLPLAVALLAQLVRQGESIETLHRRWTFQKTELLTISPGNADRLFSLDASIKLSLDSAPMETDPNAKRLLRVLSYLPNGVPSGSLERLGFLSVKKAYQALYTLRTVSLAYQDSNGTLRSLSPIRHHVDYYDPLKDQDLKTVHEYYLSLAETAEKAVNNEIDLVQATRDMRPEQRNLITVLLHLASEPQVDGRTSEAILQASKFLYLNAAPTTDLLLRLLANENFKPSNHFQAECLYMIGMVYHISARNWLALTYLKDALAIFTTLDTQRRVASCKSTIADLLRSRGKLVEAAMMFEQAKNIYEDFGPNREADDGIAFCLWGLANIAEFRGEIETAQAMLKQALDILLKEEYSLRAFCRMNLTDLDVQRGRYQETIESLREILEDCRKTEDLHDIGNCLYRLSSALVQSGEYGQAKIYAEEGRNIGDVQGLIEVSANCTRVLGHVYVHEKDYAKAEKLYLEALSMLDPQDHRIWTIRTKFAYAVLMQTKGEFQKAEDEFTAALSDSREIGYLRGVGETLLALAGLYKRDATRTNEAVVHAQEALSIFQRLENTSEVERCQTLLASLSFPAPETHLQLSFLLSVSERAYLYHVAVTIPALITWQIIAVRLRGFNSSGTS